MPTKKKAATKGKKSRVKVNKLSKPAKELSAKEQKNVKGGSTPITSTSSIDQGAHNTCSVS